MAGNYRGFSSLIVLLLLGLIVLVGAGYFITMKGMGSNHMATSTGETGTATTSEQTIMASLSQGIKGEWEPIEPDTTVVPSHASVQVSNPGSATSEIISFRAIPDSIKDGSTTTVTLTTVKGNSCSLFNDTEAYILEEIKTGREGNNTAQRYLAEDMNVAYEGNETVITYTVRPRKTTQYTASCFINTHGQPAMKELTITVH